MSMKLKIRKGDTVQVVAGSDKGLKGAVLELDSKRLKVRVQGVNIQTHFDKEEGLLKVEGMVDYSNVKLSEKAAVKKAAPKKAKKSATK